MSDISSLHRYHRNAHQMSFHADDFAYPSDLDAIKLLSQRDLASRIPINYVPIPGVSISAACTNNNTYDTGVFSRCVPNLLVTGFRRFVLDLYWDETRTRWSFCPVQLGVSGQPSNSSSTTTATSSHSTTISSTTLAVRDAEPLSFEARQTSSTGNPSSSHSTTVAISATSIHTSSPTSTHLAVVPNTQNDPLLQVGPYRCSASVDFALFLTLLTSYLDTTENNLNATTVYLSLNVHSASTLQAGQITSVTPTNLPQGSQLLSSLIQTNASAYLYTPAELIQERANVNASGSWFGDIPQIVPDDAYLTLEKFGTILISHNGWPSASFVQYDGGKRLLTGFGTIDPTMSRYNTSEDVFRIFSSGYIEDARSYQISSSEQVTSGCIYNPSTTSLASVNNSWAIAEVDQSTQGTAQQAFSALTTCGFAPVLDSSVINITADQSTEPWHELVMSTIWSWNIDEPRDTDNSSQSYHCAALNATSGYWQVESCSSRHYCACRTNNLPYDWQISSIALSYDRVDQACPDSSAFSVSRTALENDYLLAKWRQDRSSSSIDDDLLFLDFNDLDIANCWVIGQNTPCPYKDDDNSTSKLVVVPTVAAIIVFVLAILTVFVKCAANRQNTRQRRRRGNDNMGDYEGVPA